MGQSNLTAINAKTISVNGTPIAGSGAATGPVTTFDALDASAVLALNGVVKQGALPAGAVFTNYDNINVNQTSGLSVAGVPYSGAPAFPAIPTAGLIAWFDPSSGVATSGGTNVTGWTDKVGGIVALPTGDSTTPNTLVANSVGSVPGVRMSGYSILTPTSASPVAAATASENSDYSIVVVVANFKHYDIGKANPIFARLGTSFDGFVGADDVKIISKGLNYPVAGTGIKTIGKINAPNGNSADIVNGALFANDKRGGGDIIIGGYNVGDLGNSGEGDILAILVYNRQITGAETRAIHRHFCIRGGQALPGGANAIHYSLFGDSLDVGFPLAGTPAYSGLDASPAFQIFMEMGLAWGQFDFLPRVGRKWPDIGGYVAMVGNVKAVTGTKHVVYYAEYANMLGLGYTSIRDAALSVLNLSKTYGSTVIFGTSTDVGTTGGVAARQERDDYDAYWDVAANRTAAGISYYVPYHTDPNIGLRGVAPTDGNGNTYYQTDGLHGKQPFYDIRKALLKPIFTSITP
jgi:hypothetical protein